VVDFLESLVNTVRSTACSSALTAEALWGLVGNAADSSVLGSPVVNVPRAIASGAGQLAGIVCNRPPTPAPDSQYQGGQCPGVRYNFSGFYDITGGTLAGESRDWSINGVLGPTGSVTKRLSGQNGVANNIVVQGADGESVTAAGAPRSITDFEIRDITVTPVDGPNDCGDPPPEAPPLPPEISEGTPQNITFTDNDGTDVTIPVVLFFGFANINANADINIPVRIDWDGDAQLFGELNLTTGDVNFTFGNRISEPSCDRPPTDSIPDTDPDNPETFTRIVAVRVTVSSTNSPRITTLSQPGGNPTILIPNAGFVSFRVETRGGGGGQAWTTDIPVKSVDQVIPCPVPYGAVAVRGTPQPGAAFTLRSVRAEIPTYQFP
jgi:hypothetical protein